MAKARNRRGGARTTQRERKVTRTIAVYPSDYEKFKKIASVNNESVSNLISAYIAWYVAANESTLEQYKPPKQYVKYQEAEPDICGYSADSQERLYKRELKDAPAEKEQHEKV